MSLKAERDLNPTSRNQVNRAKTAAQSKNYDYAITPAAGDTEGRTSFSRRPPIFARG